ncbi:MAG: M56 family metallopeptidase [Oscillospiraceae bacterium]
MLSHERAHLARRDHWWKPLGFALLAVYWFNPLLWLAYTLLCRDIELACDERVLRGMDAGQVKDYSSALLACSVPRRMLAACPLAFGEVGVGARVKNALRYKSPRSGWSRRRSPCASLWRCAF